MAESRERKRNSRDRIAPMEAGRSLVHQRMHEAREAALRATAAELQIDPSEFGLSTETVVPEVSAYKRPEKAKDESTRPRKKPRKRTGEKKRSRYEQARDIYLKTLQGTPRGQLARSPKTRWIYKQLWAHDDLDIVARVGGDEGWWAGDPWKHYVSEHWGKSRGEINNFSNSFYKALRRQVLPRGFVLPDGTVLEKSCYAIDQVPVKRKRAVSTGRED